MVFEVMIFMNSMKGWKCGKVVDERGVMDLFKVFKLKLDDILDIEFKLDVINGYYVEVKLDYKVFIVDVEVEGDEEVVFCDLYFIVNC